MSGCLPLLVDLYALEAMPVGGPQMQLHKVAWTYDDPVLHNKFAALCADDTIERVEIIHRKIVSHENRLALRSRNVHREVVSRQIDTVVKSKETCLHRLK